jgi:hypothetical protein
VNRYEAGGTVEWLSQERLWQYELLFSDVSHGVERSLVPVGHAWDGRQVASLVELFPWHGNGMRIWGHEFVSVLRACNIESALVSPVASVQTPCTEAIVLIITGRGFEQVCTVRVGGWFR